MRLHYWLMLVLLLCVLHNQNKAQAAPEYLERIDDHKDNVVEYCSIAALLTAWHNYDESAANIRRLFDECLISKGVTI